MMSAKIVLQLEVGAAMACADERMKDPKLKQALNDAFLSGLNATDAEADEIIRDIENMFSEKDPK